MATLRGIITSFGFTADGARLASINAAIEHTKTGLVGAAQAAQGMGTGVAGAFDRIRQAVGAYLGLRTAQMFTTDFAAEAARIAKTSEALGISAESYQVWSAAAKGAGVEGDAFNMVIGKIGKNAAEAAKGQGEMGMVFRQLGVDVRGTNGKVAPLEVLLNRVSDAFAKMPAGPERTRMAMKLFEEQGAKLLPFLSKGSKGVEELRAKMLKAGIIIGDGTLAQAKKFEEARKGLMAGLLGIRNTIGSAILPYITKAITAFGKWINTSVGLKRIMEILKAIAILAGMAFAGFVAAKLAIFIVSIWKAVAAFKALGAAAMWAQIKIFAIPALLALLILLIDDLYHFWKGDKDTFVGRMLGEDGEGKLRSFLSGVAAVYNFIADGIRFIGTLWGFFGDVNTVVGQAMWKAWQWLSGGWMDSAKKGWEWFTTWLNTPPSSTGLFGVLNVLLWGTLKLISEILKGIDRIGQWLGENDPEIGTAKAGRLGTSPEPQYGPLALTPRQAAEPQYGPMSYDANEQLRAPRATVVDVGGIPITVYASTDAKPEDIAREAGKEFDRRIRQSFDDLLDTGRQLAGTF